VVLADLRRDHPTAVVRAVVQSWNTRSLRLLRTLGFLESGRHVCVQNSRPVEYVVVLLSPGDDRREEVADDAERAGARHEPPAA
jgi:L-amino acid N-acyltransferase YncA